MVVLNFVISPISRFIPSGALTGVSTAPTSCGVSSRRESSVQVTAKKKNKTVTQIVFL